MNNKFKLKRNYLKSEEIQYIVAEAMKIDNEFDRHVLIYGSVAQMLIVNLSLNFNSCNDIYDFLVENNLIKLFDKIINFQELLYCVEREFSVEATVKNFIDEFSKKIDDYSKSVDIDRFQDLVNEFKEIKDGSKE